MKTPHVNKANQYARDVVAGKIPACKWVRLACQRHLDDKRRAESGESSFWFDTNAAERACRFKEAFPHTKGKWAGNSIELEPWQCFYTGCMYGWKREDGYRRFRRALIMVPRKNGKSIGGSLDGLYMLAADGEQGAEVYSGATTEKQAWEVFRPAHQMAKRMADFQEHFGVEVNAKSITISDNGSRFEPVIGNPGDGSSPSCAIVDEMHEHKTSDLVDTMETGMGAREQPLLLVISTAGDNMAGPCYSMQLEVQKVLEGVVEDDATFGIIYTIDQDDDWSSDEAMRKANPNLGVSVSEEFLRDKRQRALNNSRNQSTYQTKHLNVWVGARDAYFNVQRWRECGNSSLKLEDYKGRRAYIGLDLASKVDVAALEILIPVGDSDYVRFGRYYLPEETVEAGENEHYKGWSLDGWIDVTDGNIIDFGRIRDDLISLCSLLQVEEVAYDPHQATMLVTELMDNGVPCVEMRPTVLNFSEPMKTLDGLIRSRQIRHNDDPVMTWMISNVVAKQDAKDNVYPRKERDENKIDGAVALIMALGRAIVAEPETVSPWEDPDFRMPDY